MIGAFCYLQFTTFRNRLAERLKRLRQPKYLIGAVVGAAYLYLVFFRRMLSGAPEGNHGANPLLPAGLAPHLTAFGALLLLVVLVLAWVLPSRRAALQFTEPEVAFLFPAPITRRRLIHFKLLRSQTAILLSTFFLVLVFRRTSYLGGHPLMQAAGWWVILSTLSLHFIGASFARDRLLALGIHPNRRRAIALGIVVAVIAACIWWLRGHVPPPTAADLGGPDEMVRYFGGILQRAPVSWILAPLTLVVRPYFASDLMSFLGALGPALAVVAAHYWWVVKADVSFEEASIDHARSQAERLNAMRAGNWQAAGDRPMKVRADPFPLRAKGSVATAFLWKNLVALGPFFRLRTWLILLGVVLGFHAWAIGTGLDRRIYTAISVGALGLGGWFLVIGPMFMRHNLRLLVTHFDLLKGYPLRGWQVVLGSLTTPILIMAAIEWLVVVFAAPGIGMSGRGAALASSVLGSGALGIALILPPLTGLMLGIPVAATFWFPAWIDNSGARGHGIEVVGQRLIFFAGYFIVLLVSVLPAVICGGLAAFAVHWLAGTTAAVLSSTVVAGIILGAEFAALVWWLGERFEQFDLSRELPR